MSEITNLQVAQETERLQKKIEALARKLEKETQNFETVVKELKDKVEDIGKGKDI